MKDGWTPKATYDTALRNLRSAEAKLAAAKANLDLTRDQLNYTELKADFDGVITAVGAEAGQNVNAGQMVVKLARPDDKDGVFNIAETAFTDIGDDARRSHRLAAVQSEADDRRRGTGDFSGRRSGDAHLHGESHAEEPAAAAPLRHEYRRPLKGQPALAVALPLSALFEKNGSPAVWVLDQQSGSVALRPVTVARYEADTVVIASGLAKGDIVVTAGVNTLTRRSEGPACRGNLGRE